MYTLNRRKCGRCAIECCLFACDNDADNDKLLAVVEFDSVCSFFSILLVCSSFICPVKLSPEHQRGKCPYSKESPMYHNLNEWIISQLKQELQTEPWIGAWIDFLLVCISSNVECLLLLSAKHLFISKDENYSL